MEILEPTIIEKRGRGRPITIPRVNGKPQYKYDNKYDYSHHFLEDVNCSICNFVVHKYNLKLHQRSKKCMKVYDKLQTQLQA